MGAPGPWAHSPPLNLARWQEGGNSRGGCTGAGRESGKLCGLESTRVESQPAPTLPPAGDPCARGGECQLGGEREKKGLRVNPGGGTGFARRWCGQLSGHKRQGKQRVEDFLPRDTGPSLRVGLRLRGKKNSPQTTSSPFPYLSPSG